MNRAGPRFVAAPAVAAAGAARLASLVQLALELVGLLASPSSKAFSTSSMRSSSSSEVVVGERSRDDRIRRRRSAESPLTGSPSAPATSGGLELIDLARDVLEPSRGSTGFDLGRSGPPAWASWERRPAGHGGHWRCFARCRSRATTDDPAQRVSLWDVCVRHQRQYLRSVMRSGVLRLLLLRLVVAPLALLAREGDSDAYVSAGHW